MSAYTNAYAIPTESISKDCVPLDSWIQPCSLLHLASKKQDQSHNHSQHICTHKLRGGRFSPRAAILLSNPNSKRSHRPASTQGMLWAAQKMQGIQRTSNTVKSWEALATPGCQLLGDYRAMLCGAQQGSE